MDSKKYMPVLKWKAGEQDALSNIDEEIKQFMLPLIEIMDIPSTRKQSPTIEEYLDEVISDVYECWGTEPIFIDFYDLDETLVTSNGEHYLQYLFDGLTKEGIKAIPVISFERDKSFLNAVLDINSKYGTGVCVRITTDFIDDITNLLASIQNKNTIPANELSLVLDLGYYNINQVKPLLLAIDAAIKTVPNIEKFKHFSICGTGFPESISNIESRSIGEIDRSEWILWNKLKNKHSSIKRLPIYGDYNVTHPEIADFDPVTMKIGGKIKYTSEEKFIIFKGSSLKKDGSEQMHSIAQSVTDHPAYMGEDFSWGDEYIAKCARKEAKPGNPKTWVTVAINHHITFVVNQLSNPNDI